MPATSFRRDRRSTVALLCAILAIPMIGLIGLAIDFGFWNQTFSTLQLAASGAALNAVKTAASDMLNGQSNAQAVADGQAAGKQWFVSQVGRTANYARLNINISQVQVTVTPGTTTSATVIYQSGGKKSGAGGLFVGSLFGQLFGVSQYPLDVAATAAVGTAPYLQVVMMLDNSSSMDIAATGPDIKTMMNNTSCYTKNPNSYTNQYNTEFTTTDGTNYYNKVDVSDNFSLFQTDGYNQGNYTPPLPGPADIQINGQTVAPVSWVGALLPGGPYKVGDHRIGPQCLNKVNNFATYAGQPCAFACHFDNNPGNNGHFNDSFGLARSLGVTLRFDLLKNATNTVLQAMASDTIPGLNGGNGNLSVGIYTFNTNVTQVYPTGCAPKSPGCEAGYDFAAAQTLVGTPPPIGGMETGIMPAVGQVPGINGVITNDNTAFPEDMNALAQSYVSPAGTGQTPDAPRKVMMLITDGFQDDPNTPYPRDRQAFNYNYCQQFKDMGYKVYVIYTPYYPLMNYSYLTSYRGIVEGTGAGSIPYNMQQCSTFENGKYDYIAATDQQSLNQALLNFLKQALTQAAIFTQ